MHGFFTLSLLTSFVSDVLDLSAFGSTVNYGLNKVRFPSPLPVGTSVRAAVSIVDINHAANGVLLTTQIAIEAQNFARPVCVAEQLRLLVP